MLGIEETLTKGMVLFVVVVIVAILIFIGLWMRSHCKKKSLVILIASISVIVFIVLLGNYHIVLDTGKVFIKRPYFGFSDIIGDIDACIGVPYFVAMSEHQSLCKALQKAGYLESDEAREKRIEEEVKKEMEEYFVE